MRLYPHGLKASKTLYKLGSEGRWVFGLKAELAAVLAIMLGLVCVLTVLFSFLRANAFDNSRYDNVRVPRVSIHTYQCSYVTFQ